MTTMAFVRSLISWQHAMLAAVAGPAPTALFALVDLEAAALDATGAREWLDFLEQVAAAQAAMLVEREDANRRALLDSVLRARRHAEEHVASFSVATATPLA